MAAQETALIVGTGPGLSASLARLFAAEGMAVALASRNIDKLADLAAETGAKCHACDAGQADQVKALFGAVAADTGFPDVVVYNASYRTRGPFVELDPIEVKKTIMISCYSGFLVGQEAARGMLGRGSGSILFTGLAQSMARELAPENIHVAHFVIDGGIGRADDPRGAGRGEDGLLHPDEIARSYLHIHRQQRSAWTWEVELRPWVENF